MPWIFAFVAVVIGGILAHALRTGTLIAHKGPPLVRREQPVFWWTMWTLYFLVMVGDLWYLYGFPWS